VAELAEEQQVTVLVAAGMTAPEKRQAANLPLVTEVAILAAGAV